MCAIGGRSDPCDCSAERTASSLLCRRKSLASSCPFVSRNLPHSAVQSPYARPLTAVQHRPARLDTMDGIRSMQPIISDGVVLSQPRSTARRSAGRRTLPRHRARLRLFIAVGAECVSERYTGTSTGKAPVQRRALLFRQSRIGAVAAGSDRTCVQNANSQGARSNRCQGYP